MLRTRWIKAGKTLTIGVLSLSTVWLIRPEGAIADGQNCNIFGCSESPGVECNTFGCPKPGAGECTPLGCPDPPVDDGSNRPDDRGRRKREERQNQQNQQNQTGGNCNAFGCSQSPGASCNAFGCPKPGGGECNPYGCPNPGAGECTAFGCPEASAPSRNRSSGSDRNRSSDRDDNRVGVPSPDFASSVFKVRGETCPSGSTLVTPAEARGNLYDAVQKLDRWDIARLANGASLGGLGYGSKVKTRDDRQLGNALCKRI